MTFCPSNLFQLFYKSNFGVVFKSTPIYHLVNLLWLNDIGWVRTVIARVLGRRGISLIAVAVVLILIQVWMDLKVQKLR